MNAYVLYELKIPFTTIAFLVVMPQQKQLVKRIRKDSMTLLEGRTMLALEVTLR